MFPCEDSKTVSVCPYPEKRNHPSFVNISPTLVIDTSMKRSSRVLQHGNPRNWRSFQKRLKLNFDLYFDWCWNRPSFVNIGSTVVNDASIDKSSRVLLHRNPKIWFFLLKKVEIEFWLVFRVVLKCWNHPSFVNVSSTLVIGTWLERFSRVPQHGILKIWLSFKKCLP